MASSIHRIAEDFATTGQLEEDDVAQLARAGFRSIVNNRPDFEGGPQQPTSEALRAAAEAAGLAYAHLPVVPNRIGGQDVERFGELLEKLPKPIVGFCRSGSRAHKLYEAAHEARRHEAPRGPRTHR